MKSKIDMFVLAIITVILLAYLLPELGGYGSPVPLDQIGSIGISLIFFFYGLKLSPEKLRAGLKNWKLHLLVQTTTFIIFPFTVLVFYPFITSDHNQILWLSVFFLAALPSTVSSSVVMVAIAKGNIPAAIFNSSISGLIGIVITPLWMGVFLIQDSSAFNLGDTYLKLVAELLLPVVMGLLLQKKLAEFAVKNQGYLSVFDKSIILLIIYKSFAESFEEKIFSSVKTIDLFVMAIAGVSLFYVIYYLTRYISKKLDFSPEDRITAQICGTKKSLVHGTVFSKVVFPAGYPIGIILLPLMLFHAFQLFVVSITASNFAKRKNGLVQS